MGCSEAARSLLEGLQDADPSTRLGSSGVQAIKDHPFFNDFNWSEAEARALKPPITFQVSWEPEIRWVS